MSENNLEAADTKENTFSLSILRKECRKLFDVSSSTFDGATCKLDQGKTYTIEETKKLIEKWKGRSV